MGRRWHRGGSGDARTTCLIPNARSDRRSFIGNLQEGVTATDLTLRITEMLRKEKVVGKFVEFFGEGAASLTVADRATIGNMAPEYGATMGFFPVDEKTLDYLRMTGRDEKADRAIKEYLEAQKLFGIPRKGEDRLH